MTDPAPLLTAPAPVDGLDGAGLDRYLFGRILALAASEDRPLTEAVGLARGDLRRLAERHVPAAVALVDALPEEAGPGADALEEPDLRALLLEHRATGAAEEELWLAAIVARRSLASNHLWQDLGLAGRQDLNALFRRHFPELVRRNSGDMKWKKFFYRALCEREGFALCKSPHCETCDDYAKCFDGEPGDPLAALTALKKPG